MYCAIIHTQEVLKHGEREGREEEEEGGRKRRREGGTGGGKEEKEEAGREEEEGGRNKRREGRRGGGREGGRRPTSRFSSRWVATSVILSQPSFSSCSLRYTPAWLCIT